MKLFHRNNKHDDGIGGVSNSGSSNNNESNNKRHLNDSIIMIMIINSKCTEPE